MLTFNQSMADSCDTVFYDWGLQFYRTFTRTKAEVLQDYARRFGFGEKTGIEIPSEKAGRVPDDGWLKRVNKELPDAFPYATWLPGYTINMSIGQGDVLATPLQLANSYAAIANGGTLYQPHFGLKFMDGNEEVSTVKTNKPRSVQVSPANLAGHPLEPRGGHHCRHGGRHLLGLPAKRHRRGRQDRDGRNRAQAALRLVCRLRPGP